MKLSKGAALVVGQTLAQELHRNGSNTIARGAVLDVRDAFLSSLDWGTREHLQEGWNKELDILEPLSSAREAW